MNTDLRWDNYVMESGQGIYEMWRALFQERERKVLYILGLGFDERMCNGLKILLDLGGAGKCDVRLLIFHKGQEPPPQNQRELLEKNRKFLDKKKIEKKIDICEWEINLISDADRRAAGRKVAGEFFKQVEFREYSDIIVDISALPRGLYFSLIAKLLSKFDNKPIDEEVWNIHVIVAHSPKLDASIQDEGIAENATLLHGFSAAGLESASTQERPSVWLPVLGRGQLTQLERINTLINPDEFCPVLPSPADNPREADDLILEYNAFLFDKLRVEPRNIIYASESNPFEVYRQIVRSIRDYHLALAPLGGCKGVVSPMSSKLSSLGVLLAAYDLHSGSGDNHIAVGVAHVESLGYRFDRPSCVPEPTLYNLWLAGEAYVK